MQYSFFADKQDKIAILEYIFMETDLMLFDSYSPLGQEVRQFKSAIELLSAFDLENDFVTLKLWSPSFNASYSFRKIDLDPKSCKGFTFRYCTEGWGLIQIIFQILNKDQFIPSEISHFSEKGALPWEDIGENKGKERVAAWDWKAVNSYSRKLKHHIHQKISVRKDGSSGILHGADKIDRERKPM